MAQAGAARDAPPAVVEFVVVGVLVAVALLLAPAAAEFRPHRDLPSDFGWPEIVVTLAAGLCAVAHRWRLDVAFWLAVSLAVVAQGFGQWLTLAAPVVAYLAFLVAARSDRRRTLIWAGWATAALVAGTVVASIAGLTPWGRLGEGPLWLWIGTATGLARRNHLLMVRALQERAERAEAAQEEVALRLIAEDRVRIARELHDVLAHHVSAINVQAGVARHLIRRDPEAAQTALGHVRAAAAAVLSESQSILGVLRQNESLQPSQPVAAPLDLVTTVEASRTLGVDVTVIGPTSMARLTPLARHAAHRFVQEAITNAGKHAAGAPVTVTVSDDDRLRIEVSNASPRLRGPTPMGFGLIGMRERLAAAGGSLAVVQDDGRFSVTADLPQHRELSE